MQQKLRVWLAALIWLFAVGGPPASAIAAQGEGKSQPTPTTTEDPGIPVDELALFLKPLTKSELLVEADAWQALLKEQAEEIAKAEIAVKRQNREIEKAAEIQDKAEEAKEKLEEVKKKAEEANSSGDMRKVKETAAAPGRRRRRWTRLPPRWRRHQRRRKRPPRYRGSSHRRPGRVSAMSRPPQTRPVRPWGVFRMRLRR
jgi:hypothetical protein